MANSKLIRASGQFGLRFSVAFPFRWSCSLFYCWLSWVRWVWPRLSDFGLGDSCRTNWLRRSSWKFFWRLPLTHICMYPYPSTRGILSTPLLTGCVLSCLQLLHSVCNLHCECTFCNCYLSRALGYRQHPSSIQAASCSVARSLAYRTPQGECYPMQPSCTCTRPNVKANADATAVTGGSGRTPRRSNLKVLLGCLRAQLSKLCNWNGWLGGSSWFRFFCRSRKFFLEFPWRD